MNSPDGVSVELIEAPKYETGLYSIGDLENSGFKWYIEGHSVIGIIENLHKQGIPSPTGKETWNRPQLTTFR